MSWLSKSKKALQTPKNKKGDKPKSDLKKKKEKEQEKKQKEAEKVKEKQKQLKRSRKQKVCLEQLCRWRLRVEINLVLMHLTAG